jgi:two-component system sensor histidine kinase UhpB
LKLVKDGIELSGQKKDGQLFPVEIKISPLETNDGILMIVAIRDITERKKSEEALRLMEQKILNQKIQEQKKITRAIIKGQEKERNYIGQELHDNVNQILVSTKLYLGIAAKNRDEIKELIKYPVELVENSIKEIRLLTGKYVTPLKNIVLKELLLELMEKLELNTGIKTNFIYDIPDGSIEDDLKLNIYRIIQEQVNNIIKHAEAKEVLIELNTDDKVIRILSKDDGKGFEVDKKRKGIGISNIINRVESFNGEINIISSSGNGCVMQIALPIMR